MVDTVLKSRLNVLSNDSLFSKETTDNIKDIIDTFDTMNKDSITKIRHIVIKLESVAETNKTIWKRIATLPGSQQHKYVFQRHPLLEMTKKTELEIGQQISDLIKLKATNETSAIFRSVLTMLEKEQLVLLSKRKTNSSFENICNCTQDVIVELKKQPPFNVDFIKSKAFEQFELEINSKKHPGSAIEKIGLYIKNFFILLVSKEKITFENLAKTSITKSNEHIKAKFEAFKTELSDQNKQTHDSGPKFSPRSGD